MRTSLVLLVSLALGCGEESESDAVCFQASECAQDEWCVPADAGDFRCRPIAGAPICWQINVVVEGAGNGDTIPGHAWDAPQAVDSESFAAYFPDILVVAGWDNDAQPIGRLGPVTDAVEALLHFRAPIRPTGTLGVAVIDVDRVSEDWRLLGDLIGIAQVPGEEIVRVARSTHGRQGYALTNGVSDGARFVLILHFDTGDC